MWSLRDRIRISPHHIGKHRIWSVSSRPIQQLTTVKTTSFTDTRLSLGSPLAYALGLPTLILILVNRFCTRYPHRLNLRCGVSPTARVFDDCTLEQ
jgi:hypothetical protein